MNEIIGAALFNFYSFYKVLRSLRKGNAVFLKSPLGAEFIAYKKKEKEKTEYFYSAFSVILIFIFMSNRQCIGFYIKPSPRML